MEAPRMFWNVWKMYIKSQLGSRVVKELLKCEKSVVGFYGSGQVEKLQSSVVVRQGTGGEAVEYCCWKSCWRTLFKVKWTIRRYQDLQ